MEIGENASLELVDVQQSDGFSNGFDSVLIHAVLEHLEDPGSVLKQLLQVLVPGGRICVGIPINSPAPDHIFLLKSPSEVEDLVREAGFEIESSHSFAASGYTLEKALKRQFSVSCVVVARRPA